MSFGCYFEFQYNLLFFSILSDSKRTSPYPQSPLSISPTNTTLFPNRLAEHHAQLLHLRKLPPPEESRDDIRCLHRSGRPGPPTRAGGHPQRRVTLVILVIIHHDKARPVVQSVHDPIVHNLRPREAPGTVGFDLGLSQSNCVGGAAGSHRG